MLVRLMTTVALVLIFSHAHGKVEKVDSVKVGVSPATSTAGVFIALERGYFAEAKLAVDLKVFAASTAPMIPLLAKGELDVGGGNLTAGLFVAGEQGIELKMVADKGSVRENADYIKLLVRSDLVTSGRYKTFKDLKGMKVAVTAMGGSSQEAAFARFLEKGQLTPKDVEFLKFSYSDANKAFQAKSIDATVTIEPYVTEAIRGGFAKAVAGVYSVHPNQQSAALFYSPQFAADRKDVAVRFMAAYIRGVRDYNAAFFGVRDPVKFKAAVEILKKYTNVTDDAAYDKMIPVGLDKNGRLNVESMKADAGYFKSQSYIKTDPNWALLVDNRFVDEAIGMLDHPVKAPKW